MTEEFFFPLLAAGFVLASWGLVLFGRHLRDRNRIQERELLHKERAQLMQSDTPLRAGSLEPLDVSRPTETSPDQILAWFRILALCVGFFLAFAGVGMLFAFSVAKDFQDIWSVGWIPTMAGLGLLVFYRLSRDLGAQFTAK